MFIINKSEPLSTLTHLILIYIVIGIYSLKYLVISVIVTISWIILKIIWSKNQPILKISNEGFIKYKQNYQDLNIIAKSFQKIFKRMYLIEGEEPKVISNKLYIMKEIKQYQYLKFMQLKDKLNGTLRKIHELSIQMVFEQSEDFDQFEQLTIKYNKVVNYSNLIFNFPQSRFITKHQIIRLNKQFETYMNQIANQLNIKKNQILEKLSTFMKDQELKYLYNILNEDIYQIDLGQLIKKWSELQPEVSISKEQKVNILQNNQDIKQHKIKMVEQQNICFELTSQSVQKIKITNKINNEFKVKLNKMLILGMEARLQKNKKQQQNEQQLEQYQIMLTQQKYLKIE